MEINHGRLFFKGFGQEASQDAPYVIVKKTDSFQDKEDATIIKGAQWAWNFIRKKCKSEYELSEPQIIISVTGGAKKFSMKQRHLSSIKRGIIKAATSSSAWIITGGTKTGVMELVGEAAKNYMLENGAYRQNLVIVGIAALGAIANNVVIKASATSQETDICQEICHYSQEEASQEKPSNKSDDKKPVMLDPHHTHFILVDDGKERINGEQIEFGGEIKFRAIFEQYLNKRNRFETAEHDIPVVLLVIEGGVNTLETVFEAVTNRTPVVVVAGSGRAADLIVRAFENQELYDEPDIFMPGYLREEVRKILPPPNENPKDPTYQLKVDVCINLMTQLLKPESQKLLTIYHPDDENDIDYAILTAILKAYKEEKKDSITAQQQVWKMCIDLALVWNRCDVAREEVFGSEGFQWQHAQLEEAMIQALLLDRIDFVHLFLENGVDIKKFLTYERLEMLHKLYTENDYTMKAGFNKKSVRGPEIKRIGMSINKLTQQQHQGFCQENSNSAEGKPELQVENPERELFIWALKFNRRELAKTFWKAGIDHIGAALTGSMILKSLADEARKQEELQLAGEYQRNAIEFESMATGVLNACYIKDKEKAHNALIRIQNQWGGETLFEMSKSCQHMVFMKHDCCQTKLNKLWKGKISIYTPMWKILIAIVVPFAELSIDISFDDYDKIPSLSQNQVCPEQSASGITRNGFTTPSQSTRDAETNSTRDAETESNRAKQAAISSIIYKSIKNCLRSMYHFYSAPVVKFVCHTASFLIYLGIFSYFLLIDLSPGTPSPIECVFLAWTVTMLAEEIRQLLFTKGLGFCKTLSNYYADTWNRFDLSSYVFFVLSVILRFTLNDHLFVWARTWFCITFATFFMRLLQAFYVLDSMGPKVVMMRRMLKDMLYFMLLILVFLLCYGVVAHALLYPTSQPSWNILFNVIFEPFMSIFGEFDTDILKGDVPGCTSDPDIYNNDPTAVRCPQKSWLLLILFASYLIIVCIMLLNMLIALFSCTFQAIHENSEETYRFYRYELINEYFEKPTLAPPLIIFNHLWRVAVFLYQSKTKSLDRQTDFKKELNAEENKRLTAFERDGVENYFRNKRSQHQATTGYKVVKIKRRLDRLQQDMENIHKMLSNVQNDVNVSIRPTVMGTTRRKRHTGRDQSEAMWYYKGSNPDVV